VPLVSKPRRDRESRQSVHPPHGISIPATPMVVLNALGYIGFKVISTSGNTEVAKYFIEQVQVHQTDSLAETVQITISYS
jgi:hypothetical protein